MSRTDCTKGTIQKTRCRPKNYTSIMARLLDGKVVLIAGGSAGIGRAAAELFARNGAKVVIAARGANRGAKAADEIRALGGDAQFVQADVSQAEDVKTIGGANRPNVRKTRLRLQHAAAFGKLLPAAAFTETDFEAEIDSNLKSIWLCMKFEIEEMLEQRPRGGSIVNTSSINGLGGARSATLYSMSKAGILALTKSAAQDYAADGIRVNALVAGGFDTEMLRGALSQAVGNDETKVREAINAMSARIPAGRIGRPDEAAEAALWLCSDAASYVTGQSMIVDGGLTAWAR